MRKSFNENEKSIASVINSVNVNESSKEEENVKSKRWKENAKRNEKESVFIELSWRSCSGKENSRLK